MMILDLIKCYWREILEVLAVVISFVILLIKKPSKLNEIDGILLKVLEKLPSWISQAESLKGADVKKSLVIESVKKYVKSEFSYSLPDSYIALIDSYIEKILETPQKH